MTVVERKPERASRPISRRAHEYGRGGPLVYLVSLAVVGLTLGPVLYGALGGFRSNEQLARDPAGLPDPWLLGNYRDVFTNPDFWQYAINSTAIAILTTAVAVFAGVMAAYPLARYQFKLMAYTDEYEVARLYSTGDCAAQARRVFEDGGK